MANITDNNIDVESFDAGSESNKGYEFELIGTDGMTGTGVYLTVVGKNSDAVSDWTSEIVDKLWEDEAMAQRRGKHVKKRSYKYVKAQNVQGAVQRVTGWRNVKQPFSRKLLETVLARNPHFIEQIIEESDDLGNFTKAR